MLIINLFFSSTMIKMQQKDCHAKKLWIHSLIGLSIDGSIGKKIQKHLQKGEVFDCETGKWVNSSNHKSRTQLLDEYNQKLLEKQAEIEELKKELQKRPKVPRIQENLVLEELSGFYAVFHNQLSQHLPKT